MTRWISNSETTSAVVYHTDKECPSFPDEVRKVTNDDERRGIRECSYCRYNMDGTLEIGHGSANVND